MEDIKTIVDIFNLTLTDLKEYKYSQQFYDYQIIYKYIDIILDYKKNNKLDIYSLILVNSEENINNLKELIFNSNISNIKDLKIFILNLYNKIKLSENIYSNIIDLNVDSKDTNVENDNTSEMNNNDDTSKMNNNNDTSEINNNDDTSEMNNNDDTSEMNNNNNTSEMNNNDDISEMNNNDDTSEMNNNDDTSASDTSENQKTNIKNLINRYMSYPTEANLRYIFDERDLLYSALETIEDDDFLTSLFNTFKIFSIKTEIIINILYHFTRNTKLIKIDTIALDNLLNKYWFIIPSEYSILFIKNILSYTSKEINYKILDIFLKYLDIFFTYEYDKSMQKFYINIKNGEMCNALLTIFNSDCQIRTKQIIVKPIGDFGFNSNSKYFDIADYFSESKYNKCNIFIFYALHIDYNSSNCIPILLKYNKTIHIITIVQILMDNKISINILYEILEVITITPIFHRELTKLLNFKVICDYYYNNIKKYNDFLNNNEISNKLKIFRLLNPVNNTLLPFKFIILDTFLKSSSALFKKQI